MCWASACSARTDSRSAAIPVVVVLVGRDAARLLLPTAAGAALVLAGAALAGFWWVDGLRATVHEYHVLDLERPYAYFLLANVAAFALQVGPASAVALARLRDRAVWLLVGGGLAAAIVANLSGLSEGEVERIWLPFGLLVLVAGGALGQGGAPCAGWPSKPSPLWPSRHPCERRGSAPGRPASTPQPGHGGDDRIADTRHAVATTERGVDVSRAAWRGRMTSVTLWARSWRWAVVGAAVAVLVSLPSVVRALPVPGAGMPPHELAARVLASTGQPFAGYAETAGRLGLPNLAGADEALGLVGETSRMRVWQTGPDAWRVDLLRVAGELDTFGDERGIWTWDSNRRVAQRTEGSFQTRLPRPHDLLPPTLGLRLVQAAAPGELQPLRRARVAGRSVPGIRIVPSSAISTVAHIDVWADASTGVPVRVVVVAEGSSRPVFSSQFLEVSLAPVAAQRVRFEPPRTARVDFDDDGDDPLERWEQRSPFVLPDEIAGLVRRTARPSRSPPTAQGSPS